MREILLGAVYLSINLACREAWPEARMCMDFWAVENNSTGWSEAQMKQDWNSREGSLGKRCMGGRIGEVSDYADL